VSLNGDLTEVHFDLGLGDQVVAVDVTTTYPPEAAPLPRVGLARQGQLSAEAVLAFEPTLVIGDTQVTPPGAVEQIRAAGVPVTIIETANDFAGVGRRSPTSPPSPGFPRPGRRSPPR
jgi:iron complex transport system substrate-binding protein